MWVVAELSLVHERIDVGRQFGGNDKEWYLKMNPNGKIPVIDDDGFILWESHSIVRYLAERYGKDMLIPGDPGQRALAEQWMDWVLASVHPAMGQVFYGLIRTPEKKRDWTDIEIGKKELCRLFEILDNHLEGRDFVIGDKFSIGDIPVGAQAYRWFALDVEHPSFPALRSWYERLASRPAFREHVMIPLS